MAKKRKHAHSFDVMEHEPNWLSHEVPKEKSYSVLNEHINGLIERIHNANTSYENDDEAYDHEVQALLNHMEGVLTGIQRIIDQSKDLTRNDASRVRVKQLNELVDNIERMISYWGESNGNDPTKSFDRYVSKVSAAIVGKQILLALKHIAALGVLIAQGKNSAKDYLNRAKSIVTTRKEVASQAKLFRSGMKAAKSKPEFVQARKQTKR